MLLVAEAQVCSRSFEGVLLKFEVAYKSDQAIKGARFEADLQRAKLQNYIHVHVLVGW